MQRSGQTRAAANPLGSALNMTDDAPDCVDGNQQIALQGPPLTTSVPRVGMHVAMTMITALQAITA